MNYYSKTGRLKEIFLSELEGNMYEKSIYIPSIRCFAQRYCASVNTIQRMFRELEAEGILKRHANGRLSIVSVQDSVSVNTTQKTTIGWFYYGSYDRSIVKITCGIEQYIQENDLGIYISSSNNSKSIIDGLKNIEKSGIDGVIITRHSDPDYDAAVRQLAASGFPVVNACGYFENCQFSQILSDEFSGIYR